MECPRCKGGTKLNMRPLRLDFQRSQRAKHLPGWCLLVVAILVTGLELSHYRSVLEEQDAVEQNLLRLEHHTSQPVPSLPPEVTEARAVLEWRLSSLDGAAWASRFAAFESAADETVTLLGLAPNKEDISIAGEAKNLAALVAYVERLQTTPPLVAVQITETETVKERPTHPLRFTLSARWREVLP